MKPYNRRNPLKMNYLDYHPPKGYINWWEDEIEGGLMNSAVRQRAKREIKKELIQYKEEMKTIVTYIEDNQVFQVPFNSEGEAENFAKTKEHSSIMGLTESIDLTYRPDAYSEEDKISKEVSDMVSKIKSKLPIAKKSSSHKETRRVKFKIDGFQYHIDLINMNTEHYSGLVIDNNRQDIDPGDLDWINPKYVRIIYDKIMSNKFSTVL